MTGKKNDHLLCTESSPCLACRHEWRAKQYFSSCQGVSRDLYFNLSTIKGKKHRLKKNGMKYQKGIPKLAPVEGTG